MMFLSLRHLFSRKKQSILILLGIIIGTASYVSISAMMMGFQVKLADQLVNNDAHIRISAREELLTPKSLNSFINANHVFWTVPPSGRKDSAKIEYPIGWFNKLDKDPDVSYYAPQVNLNVIINRTKVTQSVRLIGADPIKQEKISQIKQYMIAGKFSDIGSSGNHIIVGKILLEKIGAQLTETILISAGKSTPQPFKIVGVFETGSRNLDEGTSFTSLTDAQKLRGAPSEITDIAVKLLNPNEAEAKAKQWRLSTNEKVLAWQESNAGILSVFKTQDIVRNSMTISIIIVASFGIYNILSILVTQKKRDVAILRSMGFTPKDIVKLFFNQGLILGLTGGIVGLILGGIISYLMGQIEITPGRMGSNTGKMIISYDYLIYVKAFAITLSSTLFSSILPSRVAGKLEPIDIIRSGGQ
jgi:lipoprotein-releasing system permease protein